MKTKVLSFMLLITAMCATASGCNGNKNSSTSTNEPKTDSATINEELVEEVLQPIGDRAYYQVHGNVKTITFLKGCEEFQREFSHSLLEDMNVDAKVKQKVQAFVRECSITNSVSFDETGKSISSKKDFFTSRKEDGVTSLLTIFASEDPVYGGDDDLSFEYGFRFTYDSDGKLIKLGGHGLANSLEYDQYNHIVKESGGAEGGWCSEEIFTYDKDGNRIKLKHSEWRKEFMTGEIIDDESSVISYTILEKDSQGNWTKRKSSQGVVDERAITYY